MSMPAASAEVVIRTGWLNDPAALMAGQGVTALVLALAARGVARGTPGQIAQDEWSYHVDPEDADRAERAGLVTIEPQAHGYLVHCSAWLLMQLDTDVKIGRRLLTRLRVRRLRARRRGEDDRQLDLFEDAEDVTAEVAAVNDLACAKACGKAADRPADVTRHVTRDLWKTSATHSISARPRACGTARQTYEDQDRIRACARMKKAGPAPVSLPLVMAIVSAAWTRNRWRKALDVTERRQLLDEVRTTCKRAHLTIPATSLIQRAITLRSKSA